MTSKLAGSTIASQSCTGKIGNPIPLVSFRDHNIFTSNMRALGFRLTRSSSIHLQLHLVLITSSSRV
ncbi:hypothetical protein GcM1_238056 [Golovinomyces cichoracearum]|uniref:Uncharacterized protein n=1 Tax=Golovinomyces cichoracearum TaxID=62708 RepID=A0A420IJC1_9PEZI|nr:hypothetical protein GcM1_238056 [Golovinomyces cichoracearum]